VAGSLHVRGLCPGWFGRYLVRMPRSSAKHHAQYSLGSFDLITSCPVSAKCLRACWFFESSQQLVVPKVHPRVTDGEAWLAATLRHRVEGQVLEVGARYGHGDLRVVG
jgi:hypothetical protein